MLFRKCQIHAVRIKTRPFIRTSWQFFASGFGHIYLCCGPGVSRRARPVSLLPANPSNRWQIRSTDKSGQRKWDETSDPEALGPSRWKPAWHGQTRVVVYICSSQVTHVREILKCLQGFHNQFMITETPGLITDVLILLSITLVLITAVKQKRRVCWLTRCLFRPFYILTLAPLFRTCVLKQTVLEIRPVWCHKGPW